MRLTGVFAVHELESLFLVTEPFPIIVLAPRQVLPEHLRVEIGVHGHRRRRRRRRIIGGALNGERLSAAESRGSGEPCRREEVCASGNSTQLQRNRHGRERERKEGAHDSRVIDLRYAFSIYIYPQPQLSQSTN